MPDLKQIFKLSNIDKDYNYQEISQLLLNYSIYQTDEFHEVISKRADLAWAYAYIINEPYPEGEKSISRSAKYSFKYAKILLKHGRRFKEGEHAISKSPYYSTAYAIEIIKERFVEAELQIAKSEIVLDYIKKFIKGPFPECEPYISNHPVKSYLYAFLYLNGRFKLGERAISKNAEYSYKYAKLVLKKPFPEGEKIISEDKEFSYTYAHNVLKRRFEPGEKAISQCPYLSTKYACNVLKGRFELGENSIINVKAHLNTYLKYVIKGPWLEAEHMIANDEDAMNTYILILANYQDKKEIKRFIDTYPNAVQSIHRLAGEI